MNTTIVVWYMVLSMGHGAVVIPDPYVNESRCKAEAAKINRPSGSGGISNTFAYCIPVEKAAK